MLFEKIRSEHERLGREIEAVQSELQQLPEGNLICTRSNNYVKWYQSDGHHSVYIPRKNRKLAELLARKKYLSAHLASLTKERRALGFYLRHHTDEPMEYEQQLVENPAYADLLPACFGPSLAELSAWMKEPYEHNPIHPEQCTYKTSAGILVRSKSEALIVMLLHTKGIPFRYECGLKLGETVIYPDFTIRHPKTGKKYYWEHFGMMDHPGYAQKAFAKIQLYNGHGILPTVQLIATYETLEKPLDLALAERMIEWYFL